MQALAIKYRPKTWNDVTEQGTIKKILCQQLESNELQHCYLFVGGAGTGKTTTARIFANEINKEQGNPIELDAASNNSVDDMRDLIAQAKTRSLDSEYKVFIIDECHMITVQGWNAVLKLIEEPPAKSIFIFCTTDPQKIPKTILSRVQRYDFQRISQQGIVDRLAHILESEYPSSIPISQRYESGALEYIAKIADGGMRDAITMLDKCLAYSQYLSIENVVKALGVVDYDIMFKLTDAWLVFNETAQVIEIIEELHASGKDLKQFIKDYTHFVLDIKKYIIGCPYKYIAIPATQEYQEHLKSFKKEEDVTILDPLIKTLLELSTSIKYTASPKVDIEAALIQ